jgi:hypothetical protein
MSLIGFREMSKTVLIITKAENGDLGPEIEIPNVPYWIRFYIGLLLILGFSELLLISKNINIFAGKVGTDTKPLIVIGKTGNKKERVGK